MSTPKRIATQLPSLDGNLNILFTVYTPRKMLDQALDKGPPLVSYQIIIIKMVKIKDNCV